MAVAKICGIETEFGIVHRGVGESNPVSCHFSPGTRVGGTGLGAGVAATGTFVRGERLTAIGGGGSRGAWSRTVSSSGATPPARGPIWEA